MGRGQNSGGKRDKGAPDWLNPIQEPSGGPEPMREEKLRRRRGDDDDELDDPKGKKKGIRVRAFPPQPPSEVTHTDTCLSPLAHRSGGRSHCC